MKTRLLTTLAALLLALTSWANGVEIDGILYMLDSSTKTASVASYPQRLYKGNITIPASVTYDGITYSVTDIGQGAFYNCTGLTSITIHASVTAIERDVFCGCTGLTSISIPSSVTAIGDNAFLRCTGLTSISIPSSVTTIGHMVFQGCTGLTSISIPASVTSLGSQVFYGCTSLTSISIPASVTSIGQYMFYGCTGLTNISIPSSVTSIGWDAFHGCTGLTSVNIPASVTSIGDWAFRDCSSLASIKVEAGNTAYDSRENCNAIIETASNTLVAGCMNTTIPNSVTTIEDYAFYGCTGLTSISIPASVTSIGGYAFLGCTGLTSFTIPASVTAIGDGAFSACSGLASIKVEEGNTAYDSRENCNAIIETASNTLVAGCMNTTIPNSVTAIGNGAFYACKGLTSISIPSSVTTIGHMVFQNCTGLTSISIPSSVTYIGYQAFSGCTGLTSISIPSSVTKIGNFAFYGCTGLTDIYALRTDPAAYNCSTSAFDDVSATLPTLHVPIGSKETYAATAPWSNFKNIVETYGVEIDGIYYTLNNSDTTATVTYTGYSWQDNQTSTAYTGSITIPDSVTYGDKTYTVASIGAFAFRGCTGLTSISIPSSVTTIGARAFYGCTGLKKVVINGGFRYFFTFKEVFGDQVEELTLGKNVTTRIANFEGCDKLTSVTFHSDNIDPQVFGSQVKKFTLGEGVTKIRNNAFYPGPPHVSSTDTTTFRPTALEEIHLPSTLRTIDRYAFAYCVNLKRVHFQEGLDSIGQGAFTYCFKLENLNLPVTLRSIGEGQGWLLACKDITVDEANPYLTLQDGVLFNKEKTILLQYPAAREGESYRIPDGVKTVMGYSFEGNSHLKELTIPASVDSMGNSWSSYTRLSEIRMESSVPPRSKATWLWSDDHRLSGTWLYPAYDFENSVTLYVPRGSKETYAATAPWSNFKNIVEYDASGIEPIGLTPSEADAASYYNLQGQRIAKPQRGQIVIQRNADGTGRKVLVK